MLTHTFKKFLKHNKKKLEVLGEIEGCLKEEILKMFVASIATKRATTRLIALN